MKSYLKYQFKKVLSLLGIRVRPGGQRRKDLGQLAKHINSVGFAPKTVIDVGVADGTYELYENFSCSRLLLVEPMVEFEAVMKFVRLRYNAEYIVAAAGAESKTVSIDIGSDLHGVSLLNDSGTNILNQREINVVRLDQLCSERGLSGPYFIKVDVQGFELDVIEGAEGILEETEIIVLETSFFSFSDGMPQFVDVIESMERKGFVPYDIIGGSLRPYDLALGQVDIAFVKEKGIFRQRHCWMTEEQFNQHQKSLVTRIRNFLKI